MPYIRVGNTIYKKNPDGSRGEKVGTSKNPKRYMRALYAHETKSVSAIASPNYMHGPGSLFGVPGMGSGSQKPKRGKMMNSMKSFFDSFFGMNKTKEAHSEKPPMTDKTQTKEASLSVTKGADGKYRWILFSSSIYQDRDQEIVSKAAQEADINEMTSKKEYGTLDWWHVGTPTDDDPEPEYPMLALGDCNFSAMHNGIRIEKGTFYDERIGDMVAARAKELSASLAFRHPVTEPDKSGVFETAHTIERSILPADHASNPLADVFTTKEKVMNENKIKELENDLGEGGHELVQKLLAIAEKRESIAQAMGVRSKEAKKKEDEPGEKKPDDEGGETVKEDEAEAGKTHSHKAMLHHHKEGEASHSHTFEHAHKEVEAGHEHKNPMVDHGKHTDAMMKEAEGAKKEGEATKKEGEAEAEAAKKKKEGESAAKKEIVSTDPLVNIQMLMEKMCEKLDLIQLELEQAEDRAGTQEEPQAEALEEALAATKELKLKNDKDIAELKKQLGIVVKEVGELKGDAPAAVRGKSAASGDWSDASKFLAALKGENEKVGTKETPAGPAPKSIEDWILSPIGTQPGQ